MYVGSSLEEYAPSGKGYDLGSDLIYHYTSSAGLKGVAEDHTLWCTLAGFTNDRQEIFSGERIVDEELGLVAKTDPAGLHWLYKVGGNPSVKEFFITSFTEVADSSSMWSTYGQDGYVIVFDRSLIARSIGDSATALVRVSYDEATFRSEVRGAIDTLVQKVRGENTGGVHPRFLKAGLKSAEWQSEQEWRLVVDSPAKWIGRDDAGQKPKYALSKFGPRPYLELPIRDLACIKAVIAGPGPYMDERGHSAQWLLAGNRLRDVPVFCSKSTLRP